MTRSILLVLTLSTPLAAVADDTLPLVISGYAEAYYQWNVGNPSNGLTNARGFDNRHNSLTLSNVALDAAWDAQGVVGRLALQVGATPDTYFLAEPALAGSGAANATGPELWKFVQQAWAGYRFGFGRGLLVTAGVFLSPIGPEGMTVKDNWNESRSNLFFGLPFYHSGIRAAYTATDAWTLTLAVVNGWNNVVDNNGEKSIMALATYALTDKITWNGLYFGGVERSPGAAEGRSWRHLFDMNATWTVNPEFSVLAHANAGFEPNAFGTSAWVAGAIYGRLKLRDGLFAVLRADAFREFVPSNTAGTTGAIFWPVPWVASGTATLDYRPAEKASFRLEYRHDQAAGDLFFGGTVPGDGTSVPFVPNRAAQDTLTLGMTSWF